MRLKLHLVKIAQVNTIALDLLIIWMKLVMKLFVMVSLMISVCTLILYSQYKIALGMNSIFLWDSAVVYLLKLMVNSLLLKISNSRFNLKEVTTLSKSTLLNNAILLLPNGDLRSLIELNGVHSPWLILVIHTTLITMITIKFKLLKMMNTSKPLNK
jgi:hypothetical protein